jgi:hypothetical protein
LIGKLSKPSVKLAEAVNEATDHDLMVIDEAEQEPVYDWMNQIKMFLEVEHITHKSKQYHLIDGILFRRGANGMMMKYISREEDIQLL